MSKVMGIRLHNLEIYNWGTFDKTIWRFNPEGNTSLLTGDSGSGKSTIVDALSTLLVQPRRLAYNKAADASAKERTAKSYVLGYYGRKYSHEGKGKPEKLRDEKNYSVILATFKDELKSKTTSLAIFFWFKENDTDPSKLYIVSENELYISEDFSKFGSDVKVLRNRLRQKGAKIFDSFSNYGEFARKLLGGVSEQAIDLFQQTISMKKVEALNEFVRESMLEKEDIQGDIDELLKHYANLNTAYEAVVKAKTQIEKLTPIHNKGEEYKKKIEKIEQLNFAIKYNEIWFATKYKGIIEQEMEVLTKKKETTDYKITQEENKKTLVKQEIKDIEISIAQNGGNELANLEKELRNHQKELKSRQEYLERYDNYANSLGLKSGKKYDDFEDNKNKVQELKKKINADLSDLQDKLVNIGVEIKNIKDDKSGVENELNSLKQRTSNLPLKLVELRQKLCTDLKIDETDIPFAGELLEVKKSEISWEGAIERLLSSFAISILVPEKHYTAVSKWVNQRNLGTKLVYFKVGKSNNQQQLRFDDTNSVSSKLLIKHDSIFADWISNELSIRFPHICSETLEDFRKQSKAITINGLIRSGQRHEKDDRHNIQNRARYVLGFSNKKKIEALEQELTKIETELEKFNKKYNEISKEKEQNNSLLNTIERLLEYFNHDTIDVLSIKKIIQEKQTRVAQINLSSNILKELEKQKREKEEELSNIEGKLNDLNQEIGRFKDKLEQKEAEKIRNNEKLENETEEAKLIYPFLEKDYSNFLEQKSVNLNYEEKHERGYNNDLISRRSKLEKLASDQKNEIEKAMTNFKRDYHVETSEMTDEIQSLKEYSDMLSQLLYDNLPKYQENFKNELQGKIIRHIALLNTTLYQNSKNIYDRISEINESLKDIPYNEGRYITLNCEETIESDIRNFKIQLKSCTERMTSMDDDLIEQKFIQIKDIIGRFKGKPESLEADRRWTAKVTDVRNWFIFSATERYKENDEEYEHYSDSDGKSGGQKEKLAYTILAASLAYNYKLNKNDNQGSSFRLVVIDEAFLKSSDESAKYGLSLFKEMRFQLLVVTPLLKISTIEPFISHLGFVSHNDITHISQLKNISIEEYQENRKQWEANGFEKMD